MIYVWDISGLVIIIAYLTLAAATIINSRRSSHVAVKLECGAAIGLACWSVLLWQPVGFRLAKALFGLDLSPHTLEDGTVYLWWITMRLVVSALLLSTFCGAYMWRAIQRIPVE